MRRLLLIICVSTMLPVSLPAQVATDPNDQLYSWISVWEEKGYINNLPLLRPYPVQLLKTLLARVKEVGTEAERARAEYYLGLTDVTIGDRMPNRSLPAPLSLTAENSFWTKFDSLYENLMLFAVLQGRLGDYFTFSGKMGWGPMFQTDGFYAPEWMRIESEAESGGGHADVGDLRIWSEQLGVGTVTIGAPDLYFQAGLTRSSFGPFFENGAVIGPQASAAGHFSLTYLTDWIKISSVVLVLHPLYYKDPDSLSVYQLESLGVSSWMNFLVVHSYTLTPFSWLEVGLVQTVLMGGEFNPVFALPFLQSFFAQMVYGDSNNSLIGLYGTFKLPWNLRVKFTLYVDDFNTDTFFGIDGRSGLFSFDNAQDKLAFQVGLTWTPAADFFPRISLDYLLVTPYMYTHYAGYRNNISYTHLDGGVGTILEPNSDQVTLAASAQPAPWLGVALKGRFARHGNASEVFGAYNGDGSYYDDGYIDDHPAFIRPSLFLNQSVLEYVLQLGIDCTFTLSPPWGELELGLGYLFEYVWNKDLVPNTEEMNHYVKVYTRLAF